MVLDKGSLPELKSRPARSSFVVLSFLLAYTGLWAWSRRAWLRSLFRTQE